MCAFDRSYLPAWNRAVEVVLTTRGDGVARRAGSRRIVRAKCPSTLVPNWNLETVGRLPFLDRHHPGVVEEHVDLRVHGLHGPRELGDRG